MTHSSYMTERGLWVSNNQKPSTVFTASTLDLFSIQELKDHLFYVEDENVSTVLSMSVGARDWCQQYVQSDFLTTTRRVRLNYFPNSIQLDYGPFQSITEITYTDTDQATQTLSTDFYKLNEDTGVVTLKYDQIWPDTLSDEDNISIKYVTGATDACLVPGGLKAGVKYLIKALYDNRDGIPEEVEMSVKALLDPHVRRRL